MRIFSHTCSNTEIVCALSCAPMLVGVDADSDHPPEAIAGLPKAGRDLDLDADAVLGLEPDLVLTSLTVPGHERVVAALQAAGLRTLVCDPQSLDDVYGDIRRIAASPQRLRCQRAARRWWRRWRPRCRASSRIGRAQRCWSNGGPSR